MISYLQNGNKNAHRADLNEIIHGKCLAQFGHITRAHNLLAIANTAVRTSGQNDS